MISSAWQIVWIISSRLSNASLIPLRGGSKSISKKNIKPLAGKPLCAWVLEAATAAKRIDAVYVSTDCPEIAAIVQRLNLGVQLIERPAELATDAASTEAVMLHCMTQCPFERLVTIQATSPLLRAEDFDTALERFERERLDALLSAVRTKRFFWRDDATPINDNPLQRPRRQDFPGTLMENSAFYITRRAILEQHGCRLGGRIGIHALSQRYGFKLIEDASHAIGARCDGEPVGNGRHSDVTVFSFHPVKLITTGEGGLATTNNPELAEHMSRLRSHGITRDPAQMQDEPNGPACPLYSRAYPAGLPAARLCPRRLSGRGSLL